MDPWGGSVSTCGDGDWGAGGGPWGKGGDGDWGMPGLGVKVQRGLGLRQLLFEVLREWKVGPGSLGGTRVS